MMLMLLFKILQAFVLPSVFITVLLVGGAVFLFKRRKTGKYLVAVGVILYFAFCWAPFTNLLIGGLESQYQELPRSEMDQADQVVVLTGGEKASRLRAQQALRIYSLKGGTEIIISGKDPLRDSKHGLKLKQYLTERGVDPTHVILENQSENTFQNASYVKRLVGQEPLILVTSAYHMPRAEQSFEQVGLNPIPAPADYRTTELNDIVDYFPSGYNLYNADLAFHEYVGGWFYKIYHY